MDARFDQDEAEFAVFVFAVAFEVFAYCDGLWLEASGGLHKGKCRIMVAAGEFFFGGGGFRYVGTFLINM